MQDIQKAIDAIEAEMAEHANTLDGINDRMEALDAEIDALLAQQQVIDGKIRTLLDAQDAARGMPVREYLAFKKHYGELAAVRMSLRKLLGLTAQ